MLSPSGALASRGSERPEIACARLFRPVELTGGDDDGYVRRRNRAARFGASSRRQIIEHAACSAARYGPLCTDSGDGACVVVRRLIVVHIRRQDARKSWLRTGPLLCLVVTAAAPHDLRTSPLPPWSNSNLVYIYIGRWTSWQSVSRHLFVLSAIPWMDEAWRWLHVRGDPPKSISLDLPWPASTRHLHARPLALRRRWGGP